MLPPAFKVFPRDARTSRKLETTIYPRKRLSSSDSTRSFLLSAVKGPNDLDIVRPDRTTRSQLNEFRQGSDAFVGYLVEVENASFSKKQQAALCPGPGETWMLFYMSVKEVESLTEEVKPGSNFVPPVLSHNDFFKSEIVLRHRLKAAKPPLFSMSPPSPIKDSVESADPLTFLMGRYFTLLYKDPVAVQFFAKSALPRVHILAFSNTRQVQECLCRLMVHSMAVFDRRHEFSHMVNSEDHSFNLHQFNEKWVQPDILLDASEEGYRKEYLEHVWDTVASASTEKEKEHLEAELTKLKIRDAKLQILVGLELLYVMGDTKTSEKPKPKPKKRLVGRKRKLLPTFIGTAIEAKPLEDASVPPELDSEGVEKLVRGLFDRLCVWDAILEVSEKSEESCLSFLKSSVIPFFSRKHHHLLKEFVRRSKGIAPRAQRKKHHHHKHMPVPAAKSQSVALPAKKSSSLAGLDLAPSLKRSTSSLTFQQDLSKKTFEMVSTASFSQMFKHKPPLAAPVQPSQSQDSIFMHSQRRRLVAPKRKTVSTEVTEIKATPAKKRVRRQQLDDVKIVSSSPMVAATPAGKPSTDIISPSPAMTTPSVVDSSPVKKAVARSARRRLHFD